jgi:DNA-binding FadR family transcriptional regulator
LLAEIDAINQIINNNFSLDKLKDVLLKEKNVIKNELIDIEEMVLLDCEFHETLVKSSRNTVLFLLFMAFKEIELDLVRKFYNSRSRFIKVVQIHDELVLLIENKNKDKAIEIWDKLLKQGAEVVLSEL